MYFFILILCLNTITSMIKTNVFFDFTDFQAGLPKPPLGYSSGTCFMATVSAPPEGGSDDGTMANMMQSLMGDASATLIGCYAKGTFRMQIVLDG